MKTTYRLGDWVFVCDQCGGKRHASTGKRDWQGLFVCPECFDIRNPQDFVKGVKDNQTVPWARSGIVQTMGTTAVKTAASKGDLTLDIDSISDLADEDSIGIVMDDGTTDWKLINGTPAGNTVTFNNPLIYSAAVDNTVYKPTVGNETFITATSVTATGL